MSGDLIVRQGEIAETMYFIRQGYVDVSVADGIESIAFMEEGSYFGEIGVLLQDRRSTSVLAHTNVILCSIDKHDMLHILDKFPDHKRYLTKVAE
jgi:CRP-like cAMP-binding protein